MYYHKTFNISHKVLQFVSFYPLNIIICNIFNFIYSLLTIALIFPISPGSSAIGFFIALNNKLYLVNLCIGCTKMSASRNLEKKTNCSNNSLPNPHHLCVGGWWKHISKKVFLNLGFDHIPIAQLLSLTPCQVRLEKCVVAVQFFAVELASALFGAVFLVGRENRVEREEGRLGVVDAHRMAGVVAVLYL